MIPYRSLVLTAVPRSLEKRLEIVNAIRALVADDDNDPIRKRRAEIAALRRDFEKLREEVLDLWRRCEPRARSYVIKYNPDQPRVPAGNPDGGQWTSEGADTPRDAVGVQVAAGSGRPGYPIDLQEEEARGGHTIGAHVGRSESSLLFEIREIALSAGAGVDLTE